MRQDNENHNNDYYSSYRGTMVTGSAISCLYNNYYPLDDCVA